MHIGLIITNIQLESTGYSALPSPLRYTQRDAERHNTFSAR